MKLAQEQNNKSIIKYYGLLPWLHLITIAKTNNDRSIVHRNNKLLRETMKQWKQFIIDTNIIRESEADRLYKKHTYKRVFKYLKMVIIDLFYK